MKDGLHKGIGLVKTTCVIVHINFITQMPVDLSLDNDISHTFVVQIHIVWPSQQI